jgi:hypothetical protein
MNPEALCRRANKPDLRAPARNASRASARKNSWLTIGARSAAQTGKPGTKLSGNATSDEPLSAASSIRLIALSIVPRYRERSARRGRRQP